MSPGKGEDGIKGAVKSALALGQTRIGVDRLFRFLNRDKLLVLMYHGVTEQEHDPPVWTQLPVALFRDQMAFLRDHYRVLSLEQCLAAHNRGERLPERSALITFDDGFKNNLSVAFPVLQAFGLPATIFLTTDFIGTRDILWFDELLLLILEGARRGVALKLRGPGASESYRAGALWEAYLSCLEAVKRGGADERGLFLHGLRRLVPLEKERWLTDFGPLSWQDVRHMERSGLISFGVHTATHRILTELKSEELADELAEPRKKLARELEREPHSFCFPNGRPGVDFSAEHQEFLRGCGYHFAFSTEDRLFDWQGGDRLGISRIAAGNDGTSEPHLFRLRTSGAFDFLAFLRELIS